MAKARVASVGGDAYGLTLKLLTLSVLASGGVMAACHKFVQDKVKWKAWYKFLQDKVMGITDDDDDNSVFLHTSSANLPTTTFTFANHLPISPINQPPTQPSPSPSLYPGDDGPCLRRSECGEKSQDQNQNERGRQRKVPRGLKIHSGPGHSGVCLRSSF